MKKLNRLKKHKTIRRQLSGTTDRPRLSVFRSTQHIYAQVIDDLKGKTIAFESDVKIKTGTKSERAFLVGKTIAQKAAKSGVKQIVFDRGGFLYHGRIKALADGAREGGLKF